MMRQYTAADLLAVSEGKLTLRREPRISRTPLPSRKLKQAIATQRNGLPAPGKRLLTAIEILAVSENSQPWHALKPLREPLSNAG